MRRIFPTTLCSLALGLALAGCGDDTSPVGTTTFDLTFENISMPGGLPTAGGSSVDIVYAAGVWAVFEPGGALFVEGTTASDGIRNLAEDGNNITLLVAAEDLPLVSRVGIFGQGVTYDESPLTPGVSVETEVVADPGEVFSFCAMFVQANDVFIAPIGGSIPLFDASGAPVSGDLTAELTLYDAGTEVNQPPGEGADQGPRQSEAGMGEDEDLPVTRIVGTDASGFSYPDVVGSFRLTVTPR